MLTGAVANRRARFFSPLLILFVTNGQHGNNRRAVSVRVNLQGTSELSHPFPHTPQANT